MCDDQPLTRAEWEQEILQAAADVRAGRVRTYTMEEVEAMIAEKTDPDEDVDTE